jgi:PEP-CTERM motif
MKNLSLVIAGAACVALGGVGSAQAATLIDTTPTWSGYYGWGYIGETSEIPNYAYTFGQTFTVGSDNILNDFTFYVDQYSNPVDFGAYIMAWDGTKTTGSIIYQSGKKTTNNNNNNFGAYEQFTFNTGGTSLTSGQQYVAFVSGFEFLDGVDGLATVGLLNSDVYTGGTAVYLGNNSNAGTDFTINNWGNVGSYELAFKANLSSASAQPVPEPSSSLGLLAFGGFVAGKILKRKKAQLKIESQDKE